ncbi:TnsA endonuclease N-terminal domain-containing protein [Psychromonas ossibalaenae]|uniref:TnsA endonuclease N-terminal domain-containing protein n=1 Tax=Psychromonas ossibalaenae TaxID=444922 RepID=UPI00036DCAC0|nr:TnsA endonuclease N-terminal domain-containing protein [Psychromonas ossibalaenae]
MNRKISPQKRNLNNLLSKSITKFPSIKSDTAPVITESPLEADFCYYLEFDKEVIKYEAQPLGFSYWLNKAKHTYTPDFEVFYVTSSCYYEIKFEKDILRDKEFKSRFEIQKKAAQELGKDLFLITDSFILKRYKYENLCLLYKFSKIVLEPEFLLFIKSYLTNNRELTILELVRQESRNSDFQQIYKLIWDQTLLAEMESEIISINTVIKWWNK